MEACAKIELDKMGVSRKHLAAVNCDKKCDTCGWNPEEQKRRIETGSFKPVHTRRGWDEDTGNVIEVTLQEGTRQLVFAKKEVATVECI